MVEIFLSQSSHMVSLFSPSLINFALLIKTGDSYQRHGAL